MNLGDFDGKAFGVVRPPFAIIESGADIGIGMGEVGHIGVGVDVAGVIISNGGFLSFSGIVVVRGQDRGDLFCRGFGGRIGKGMNCIR